MKCKFSIVVCMLLGFVMAFTSCVKDNEIGQNNSSEPSSSITSDLIVSSLNASSFNDESTQQERVIYLDTTQLDLMSSDFFNEELIKSNLSFHFKNSLNKDFRVDFEFLNDRNELKFALQIPISAGSKEKPISVKTSVVIETPELSTFKEATKLVYKITLLTNDEFLLSESEGELELHSDATYFFDI